MRPDDTFLEVVQAEYLAGYRLRIVFNDGTVRIVDFGDFLRHARNPMIRKYLDVKRFQDFSIEYGDLFWHDYELCFPIADLYRGSIEHSPVESPRFSREYQQPVANVA